ncbi:hypothetical protein MMC12_006425 [Toensbergia leucococca]|nr:hypothetical protein [Toensbergia leucococca]
MRTLALIIAVISACHVLVEASSVPCVGRAQTPRIQRRETEEEEQLKYFHEPGGSELLSHYDKRYFHEELSYMEKKDTQLHMIRAYLNMSQENGIETWIAHGTLLGWWWNGKVCHPGGNAQHAADLSFHTQMLPWDWDIDTQVSTSTLQYLGEHMNRTIHRYTLSDTELPMEREYLLDVNPAIQERERGDGFNIIDARWIDIRNGLYIDITGLSETHPSVQPGVWVCKNYHRYHTSDLYPMRESVYEGVLAKVPYAYDRILMEEYESKALVLTTYEGYAY